MNNNLTIWSHWCAVKGTRNGRRRLTVPLKVAFASQAGSIVSDAATAAGGGTGGVGGAKIYRSA